MAGIYGLISKNQKNIQNIYQNFYSSTFPKIVNEEFKYDDFTFGRSVLSAFLKDRFIYQDEELIFAFEGICYSYNKDEVEEKLISLYKAKGKDFIRYVEGQFCGFVYDKFQNRLHIFTDQLSTKPLYYLFDKEKEILFFSSELKVITRTLRDAKIPLSPDNDAFRCLLTFGYMLGDLTPVQEVKKISPGTITTLHFEDFIIENSQYFSLEKHPIERKYENILQDIDDLITKAIKSEWEKDLQYNLEHFTFLSGGLDSRVNAVLGSSLTSSPTHSLTFSAPNTPDQKIAQQIAEDLEFKHTYKDFEDGKYLVDSEYEYVKANDGLVAFYGAAHQQYSLQNYNLMGKGLAHSGQIGDVIFGSFTKEHNSVEGNVKKLAFNLDLDIINKIGKWQNYKRNHFDGNDLEVFSLKHRQINGTMNGDRCCAHLADLGSPFYNKELISYCLNIPDKFKYNQSVYLDWLNIFHPKTASYKWAATGALPSNNLLHKTHSFSNRLMHYLLRKVGIDKKNMNPHDVWYKTNSDFKESLQKAYSTRMLEGLDSELIADIEHTFTSSGVTPKMLAVTAILSYKLHFLD